MSKIFKDIVENIVFNDTAAAPYSTESLVRRALVLGVSDDDIEELFGVSDLFISEQVDKNLSVANKVIQLVDTFDTFDRFELKLQENEQYYSFARDDVPKNIFSKLLNMDLAQIDIIKKRNGR